MSDEKKPEAEKTDNHAKPGQDDYGKTVTTAGGEPFSGTISDIVDGDDKVHHPHKHK